MCFCFHEMGPCRFLLMHRRGPRLQTTLPGPRWRRPRRSGHVPALVHSALVHSSCAANQGPRGPALLCHHTTHPLPMQLALPALTIVPAALAVAVADQGVEDTVPAARGRARRDAAAGGQVRVRGPGTQAQAPGVRAEAREGRGSEPGADSPEGAQNYC